MKKKKKVADINSLTQCGGFPGTRQQSLQPSREDEETMMTMMDRLIRIISILGIKITFFFIEKL